ncbi:MAG: patatin-like phospholipase family protein [Tissierellia bacterium]|nr:patatin-like phospholipase family protein [Tissierellia bacterium]
MIGLALEGGGAKGSYQVGAYKALKELGYKFDYIVGTSIGAINGVIFAQHDEEIAERVWSDIKYSTVVDADDKRIQRFINEDLTFSNLKEKFELIKEVVSEGGFDTTPFKELLEQYVDEEKLRRSDIRFGLVTVDLSNMKPIEVFIEDMEPGSLKQYLYASSNLPIFRQEPIDGRYLIDGGFYSNNPVKMIEDKCDEVINILLYPNRLLHLTSAGKNVKTIMPREKLADIMNFNSVDARYGIELGYHDTYKYFQNLLGDKYYIIDPGEEYSLNYIAKLYEYFKEGEPAYRSLRQFLELWVSDYIKKNKLNKDLNYSEVIAAMLEKLAICLGVERFKIYDINELAKVIFEDEKYPDYKYTFYQESKIVDIINSKNILGEGD